MNKERRDEIQRYVDRLKELQPRINDIKWRRNSDEILFMLHRDIDYNYRNIKKYVEEESRCIKNLHKGLSDIHNRNMTEHYKMLKSANEEIRAINDILARCRLTGDITDEVHNSISERFLRAITSLEIAIEDPHVRWIRNLKC